MKPKPVPPKSILDKTFKYTPAVHTDLRATFERVRAERAKAAGAPAPAKEGA